MEKIDVRDLALRDRISFWAEHGETLTGMVTGLAIADGDPDMVRVTLQLEPPTAHSPSSTGRGTAASRWDSKEGDRHMTSTNAPSGQIYHHNGDFSGDVSWETDALEGIGKDWVSMPFEDMRHLVLEHIRSRAISILEQADDATLEKFFLGWSVK